MERKEHMAAILVLAAAFLWGCIGIFVRHLSGIGFNAMQMTATKSLINSGLLFLFLLISDREKLKIRIKDLGWFLANGVVSILMFNTAYNAAITMISLSAAVVLLYTAPVFVMLMSVLFFHERFTARKGVCLVLCILGSSLVSGLAGGMELNVPGILLGLLSGIGYALYSIFSTVIVKKYHPLTNVFYTFLIAGAAASLCCDMGGALSMAGSSGEALFWTVMNGVCTSFIPYITYTLALQYMQASKAAIIATLEPVVATLVGTFLYHETVTFTGGIGIFMVFAALLLSNLPEKAEIK